LPSFGVDFVKLSLYNQNVWVSFNSRVPTYGLDLGMDMVSFRLLTGFRLSSRRYGWKENKSFYTALRFGVGYFSKIYYRWEDALYDIPDGYVGDVKSECFFGADKDLEFCVEWDALMYQWRRFFIGLTLNYDVSRSYLAKSDAFYTGPKFENNFYWLYLRLGVDLGKKKTY